MFTPIDPQTWNRGQIFYYFSEMAPTGYSLTVKTDVTKLYRSVKDAGIKFFPAYLWLVTKNLNKQTEFKCAVRDGQLGYFDTLTPLFAVFHEDDNTFSLMWVPFKESFSDFYGDYLLYKEKYADNHGILSQPQQLPPENAYTVSCLPWVHFEHFAVHSYENKPYYFPSVEAGKFENTDGKLQMPLSITCHHATTDGIHIRRFLDDLQADMDTFQQYLK